MKAKLHRKFNQENELSSPRTEILCGLVKYLDNIADDEIVKMNIPTGVPLVYELDENLKSIKSYYLGDAEAIRKAQEAVANQGKPKKVKTRTISVLLL